MPTPSPRERVQRAQESLALGLAEPLECCRNRLGPEARHLRVIGQPKALCGKSDQDGAGAGRFASLLRWPTCAPCRIKAEAMGAHPSQNGNLNLRMAQLTLAREVGGEEDGGDE